MVVTRRSFFRAYRVELRCGTAWMSRSPELAAATVDQVGELIAVPSINIANGAPSMDSLAWARDVEEPDDPVMTSAGVGTVAVVDKS
jgi:hypothetical protein